MASSRIFWRVLLAFVAVNVLTVALFVLVLRPVLSSLDDPRGQYRPLAEQTVAEFEQRELRDFAGWLRRSNRQQRMFASLLDADGRPLLRRLPGPVKELPPQVLRDNSVQRLPGGARFIAIPVRGQQGAYRWVAILPPSASRSAEQLAGLARIALSVILLACASWWLSRWLVRPIQQLTAAARSIGGGDLTARVDAPTTKRRDELGELAREFNQMAGHTQAMVAARNRLLIDVSHELRSPLARLTVATELARDGDDPAAALDRIEHESQRMDSLIGETLAAARAQERAGALEPIDLAMLLRDAVDDLRFEHGAVLPQVNIDAPEHLQISADAILLRRAIDNVLRNAARYGAAGTSIDVGLALEPDKVVIQVRDFGPGVAADELQRIFQPFYRTATARDRSTGGHGIGLAIVAEAAARHGGRAYAERPHGGGLRVCIVLPN